MKIERSPASHKGENGTVLIIGGSKFQHGAPIFSALAAEKSGVDLIFVALPKCHSEVAKNASYNFQVHPFDGDDLSKKDINPLLELLATCDSAIIGPGIAKTKECINVLEEIIDGAQCALVLDATALQPSILKKCAGKNVVLTPHLGELERLEIDEKELPEIAKNYGITILLKNEKDIITGPDGAQKTITGGNAGLTVGGTGDALAGLTAGLLAQHLPPVEAAQLASTLIKKAGDTLRTKSGFAYQTFEVIELIPSLLASLE